jgi:hypothetical protein
MPVMRRLVGVVGGIRSRVAAAAGQGPAMRATRNAIIEMPRFMQSS